MNLISQKTKILFISKSNSARSQIAEALLRHKTNDDFEIYSAGISPENIDIRTIEVLNRLAIQTSLLKSTHIDEYSNIKFDYIISLCDTAITECRTYQGKHHLFTWDFACPKTRGGIDPFTITLEEIDKRLTSFLRLEFNYECDDLANSSNMKNTGLIAIDPVSFYKCLTDITRLNALLLTNYFGELCVCELMHALQESSQPKVSRNLAILKKAQIITDRKHGQWVFYRINPNLPFWIKSIISQTSDQNLGFIKTSIERLHQMKNRPDKSSFCK